jgi:hypothetical protein
MRTHLGLVAGAAVLVACGGEAGTTSSTGTSSTGGPSSSSGAGGGCGAPNTQLEGTLDGAAVSEAFFSDATSFSDEGELGVTSADACGHGLFFVTPTAPPVDGGPEPFTGLFRMPAPGPGAGAWFCAAEATASNGLTPGADFTLTSLSKLGACPGEPVDGVVNGCLGVQGSAGCEDGGDSSLVSTLAGATFSWADPARGVVAALGPGGRIEVLTSIPSDGTDGAGSRLEIEFDGVPANGGTGKVTGGVLLIGPGGPDPGGVYCVGGGTVGDAAPRRFTLTGLSRLGACGAAPVGGSLAGHKKS